MPNTALLFTVATFPISRAEYINQQFNICVNEREAVARDDAVHDAARRRNWQGNPTAHGFSPNKAKREGNGIIFSVSLF